MIDMLYNEGIGYFETRHGKMITKLEGKQEKTL